MAFSFELFPLLNDFAEAADKLLRDRDKAVSFLPAEVFPLLLDLLIEAADKLLLDRDKDGMLALLVMVDWGQ